MLRIDPATGEPTKRTRFPSSGSIDGLAAGLGSVWVVASSSGVLYRIDPRSGAVTGRVDLGERAPPDPRWCRLDLGRAGGCGRRHAVLSTLGR